MSLSITSKSQFEQIFREHYRPLVGYAAKMLSDRDLAEDVVQQLFVSVWEKREVLTIEGSTRSYLLRSTHNTCLNQIKHEKVKQDHAKEVLSMDASSDQRDLLEEEEFSQKVKETVKGLPTQCRKIFLMSRVQGKKYQQIADELNLSVKTIENQMGKALRTLREELKPEHSASMRIIKTILWLTIGVNVFSIVMR